MRDGEPEQSDEQRRRRRHRCHDEAQYAVRGVAQRARLVQPGHERARPARRRRANKDKVLAARRDVGTVSRRSRLVVRVDAVHSPVVKARAKRRAVVAKTVEAPTIVLDIVAHQRRMTTSRTIRARRRSKRFDDVARQTGALERARFGHQQRRQAPAKRIAQPQIPDANLMWQQRVQRALDQALVEIRIAEGLIWASDKTIGQFRERETLSQISLARPNLQDDGPESMVRIVWQRWARSRGIKDGFDVVARP